MERQGVFRSAAILVDSERRQDIRLMKHEDVVSGVKKMQITMSGNRLRKHLEKCALEYGCQAGVEKVLSRIKKLFSNLKYGYFNPPKERFR